MPLHFANFLNQQTSPGVFLVPRRIPVLVSVEELILIGQASESEDWTNRILTLPL
jgi:hypothetical protein